MSSIAVAEVEKPPKTPPSIAFYYSDHVPIHELRMFDIVVVESNYVSEQDLNVLRHAGVKVLAYVSVGEVRRNRAWYQHIDQQWILGKNKAWGSELIDLSQPDWHQFLTKKIIAPMVERGFSGVFLDTLDSYHLLGDDADVLEQQRLGLATLIQTLHQDFPDLHLLLNRGFDVIDQVHQSVHGVVAESLFQTWRGEDKTYRATSHADQTWLHHQLSHIHAQYHLPIYVIDYVAPDQVRLAKKTAKKILKLGFSPWVTQPSLSQLGVGSIRIIPRKILVLYDGQEAELAYSSAHRLLAAPLEYLGYQVVYHDAREWLAPRSYAGTYAGVVCWFSDGYLNNPQRLMDWLSLQMDAQLPIVFLNFMGMPMNDAFLSKLGLMRVQGSLTKPIKLIKVDSLAQMEAKPQPLTRGLELLRAVDERIVVHAKIADARGVQADVIVTAPWGGMALNPYVLEESLDDKQKWRLHIFDFLQQALKTPKVPVFDVSTENGQRLLMTHIDGDGAASRAVMLDTPLAIDVIYQHILKKFPFPATVSVISSEMQDKGFYPKRAAAMRRIAKNIFALAHVEMSSHTYSHPFNWVKAVSDKQQYLQIPGYTFDLKQEIDGSVQYIDRYLSVGNKKITTFLWSGDALPTEEALRMVRQLGLKNMNGGNTAVTNAHPSLTNVSGMARPVGQELQVYAPVMNENIYTDLWQGPRYGFERVIETFKLTDFPRRLKPIDIYYHFYSGSDAAGLAALKRVYRWAMRQETFPVFVSDYVAKVEGFYGALLAQRTQDDAWLIFAPKALRTLRIPKSMGWPNFLESQGVVGVRDTEQGRYVHLSGTENGQYVLQLQAKKPTQAYLVKANAQVLLWQVDGKKIQFRLKANVPISFAMNRACTLRMHNKTWQPRQTAGIYVFQLKRMDTGHAQLSCQ